MPVKGLKYPVRIAYSQIFPISNIITRKKLVDKIYNTAALVYQCGCNSAVECQLPKLNVAGSIPVTRSKNLSAIRTDTIYLRYQTKEWHIY